MSRSVSGRVAALTILNCSLVAGIVVTAAFAASGQRPAVGGVKEGKGKGKGPARPPLFFREDWKHTPAGGEHALLPESVGTPDLVLNFVGPAATELII